MRISSALVIIATMAQAALVMSAPARGNNTRLLPPKNGRGLRIVEHVDLEPFYDAMRKANNFTAKELQSLTPIRTSGPSARAATNTVTTLYCIAVQYSPTLQFKLVPDTHKCYSKGWNYLYSFTTFNYRNNIATTFWDVCDDATGGTRQQIFKSEPCPNSRYSITRRFANDRDSGCKSFVSKDPYGNTYMDPYATLDTQFYPTHFVLNHLGVFHAPTLTETVFMTDHIAAYPDLYRYTPDPTAIYFSTTVVRAAQIVVNNLPGIHATSSKASYLSVPSTFRDDLIAAGHGDWVSWFRIQVGAAVTEKDGARRRSVKFQFNSPDDGWSWMGGIVILDNYPHPAALIRTAFTESLRDFVTVRLDLAPTMNWMITPVPTPVNPNYRLYASHF